MRLEKSPNVSQYMVFPKKTLFLLVGIILFSVSSANEPIIDQDLKLPDNYQSQWEKVAGDSEPVMPGGGDGLDPHLKILQQSKYPSAALCGRCHQRIFTEWASSNHAYASISPMFHKFEQAVNALTSGTMGTFCVRFSRVLVIQC